jgi:hypothetical protein
MNQPNDGDLVSRHLIDEAVPAQEQLSNVLLPQLGNHTATLRQRGE